MGHEAVARARPNDRRAGAVRAMTPSSSVREKCWERAVSISELRLPRTLKRCSRELLTFLTGDRGARASSSVSAHCGDERDCCTAVIVRKPWSRSGRHNAVPAGYRDALLRCASLRHDRAAFKGAGMPARACRVLRRPTSRTTPVPALRVATPSSLGTISWTAAATLRGLPPHLQ